VTNKLFYGDISTSCTSRSRRERRPHLPRPAVQFERQLQHLFKSKTGDGSDAQIEAFEDTWHWNDKAEQAFDEVMRSGLTGASELLRAMRGFSATTT
jgi:site-specific DNA-methyltransferase (adenine-specific)